MKSIFALAVTFFFGAGALAGGGPPGAGGGWFRAVEKDPYTLWVRVDAASLKLTSDSELTLQTHGSGSGAIGYPAVLKSKTKSNPEEVAQLLAKAQTQHGTITASVTLNHYEFLRFPPHSPVGQECIRNIAHDVTVSFDGHEFTVPTEWIAVERMSRAQCDSLAKSVVGFRYL